MKTLILSLPVSIQLDHINTMITSINLANDNFDPRAQPSKLWASREEFQETSAPQHPSTLGTVPTSDILESVASVANSASTSFGDESNISPSHSPSLTWQRQNLSRAARTSIPSKIHHFPPKTKVTQPLQLLEELERRIRHADGTLRLPMNPSALDDTAASEVRLQLHEATMEVERIRHSLQRVSKVEVERVKAYTTKITALLDGLAHKITLFEYVLPSAPPATDPVIHNSEYVFKNPIEKLDITAQLLILLGVICHVLLGVAADPCNFIISSVFLIVESLMATRMRVDKAGQADFAPEDATVREQLPRTLRTIKNGSTQCCTPLLQNGKPIKPFLVPSLPDFFARELSDLQTEETCMKACDDAYASLQSSPVNDSVTNIFQAEFMKSFEGPTPGKLFIERNGKVRLAFALQLDFFNPNGTRPKEPELDSISHYLTPIIDQFIIAWNRGIHVSRTASSPNGRTVEAAIVLSVNDLPAARKVGGFAGHMSNWFCGLCKLFGRGDCYRTDYQNWRLKDVAELRQQAQTYRDAKSGEEKERLFTANGVRWSELWRLPYWDPTRMLVVDSMHCILEGLVHYHCRKVLGLDSKVASTPEFVKMAPAFTYEWPAYDAKYSKRLNEKEGIYQMHDRDEDQIQGIHELLQLPFECEPRPCLDENTLTKRLADKRRPALRYICWSLKLSTSVSLINDKGQSVITEAKYKHHFITLLLQWVGFQLIPKPALNNLTPSIPRAVNGDTVSHVQNVIKETVTPSWIEHVPYNYCEANAGTIKADEWRTLSTLYLPIALTAADLICRYAVTPERAQAFRSLLKEWVDGLYENHPHTKEHKKRTNVHIAFHLYEFLILFGPVISWWCFPFERLIGTLQKVNTNNHIGGEMEATIVKSYVRSANLRRWLNRKDCPQFIRTLKGLFNKAYHSNVKRLSVEEDHMHTQAVNRSDRAHYQYNGVNFSRSTTHLGNSLVLFTPLHSTEAVAGSIQRIEVCNSVPFFHIQRQKPLPLTKFDPFKRYPWFFAKTYSSKMSCDPPERVPASRILSHVARYNFSDDRAVILNLSRD
ncbi:hypothetical protein BDP27DRAFT_1368545 [Rhodocollybia butyracea]|uniref:Uncharacterized protein n=1 Tax=Rhodocollybia butyracea TaxID=206335 RepID=A0A9P5U0Q2_9AGAR|nr:hypothetical protein BDP27DRAFT_1368545 [Rhodocollybia butyracea]